RALHCVKLARAVPASKAGLSTTPHLPRAPKPQLPRRSERDLPLAPVFPGLHADPVTPAQRRQRSGNCRLIESEQRAQAAVGDCSVSSNGLEQVELRNAQTGPSGLTFVQLRAEPSGPSKIRAEARKH